VQITNQSVPDANVSSAEPHPEYRLAICNRSSDVSVRDNFARIGVAEMGCYGRGARMSITGHSGAMLPEHFAIVLARSFSSLVRSASLERIRSR